MTNFAILSLTDNVEKLQAKVNRVQKSYNSLKDKTSWFASEHEKLLAADLECLAVYKRHLAAAQKSLAVDGATCPYCQKPMLGNNHIICGAVAESPRHQSGPLGGSRSTKENYDR